MDTEKCGELFRKIKAEGSTLGVDFADGNNAYMVWADHPTGVMYCGGRRSVVAAQLLAAQHTELTGLYVVRTNPPAILPVDDKRRS
jgi:hypothetical protein